MDVHCKKDFGSELAAHIPYAYYLHTQNKLKSTTSSLLSKEFYYFSDDHKHTPLNKPNKVETNVLDTTLNVTDLNREQYIPPPYKDIYKNNIFIFDKPLLIIHNKYTAQDN